MKNIKKLVSIFIAVTMVFSMTAMPVPIALADDEAYSPPTHVKDAPSGVKNNSWEPQHTHEHADRGVPATENREKSSVSIANRNTERPEK
ncbi:MAG: hypothetical protein FWG53_03400, partial [Clostridiales bacterium]|nr:hypothetical protein [Clostridiales bacterium]